MHFEGPGQELTEQGSPGGTGPGWRAGTCPRERRLRRGVRQHAGWYRMAYLGWLRQEDGIVGEEDGDTFLCKCVELLCESDTRKLCRGLTKIRITCKNNAYWVHCMVFSFFFFSSV